ncbi:ABC transporter substrate-binding protein [Bacillus sp. J14TS2]|uniref:ABC transporter substrate-binding protein n=1 Tax=Bacillus sp. J14TS2 TaxID=2807188 RepID=UPI001BB3A5D8|nr:extracellular solute-binding protein [Bacillus sp. J14TS2]
MMLVQKKFVLMIFMLISLVMMSGCHNDTKETVQTDAETTNDQTEVPEMPDDPITLSVMLPWDDEMFADYIKDDVEEHFPNITLELIDQTVDATGLEETFSKNMNPDIVLAHNGYEVLKEFDVAYPLDDLVEQNQYDLDRFREGLIDIARARDPYGEDKLYGLPFEDLVPVLYYNKSIFDQFGVDYPEDNMTWDEVIDLARKVTGEKGGTTYRGLTFGSSWYYSFPLSQLSVNGTDPETGEVLFTQKEEFTRYLDLIDQITSIPGNFEQGMESTFVNQDVAMTMHHLTNISSFVEAGIDFGMVSFPVWKDKPNSAPYKFIGQTLAISKHSENKLAAFKVIDYLTSAEKQTKNASVGRISPLKDLTVMNQFLSEAFPDHDFNIEGVLSVPPAEPPVYSKWGPDIQVNPNDFYSDIAVEFIESGDDPTTVLRRMEETYQTKVEEEMNKN